MPHHCAATPASQVHGSTLLLAYRRLRLALLGSLARTRQGLGQADATSAWWALRIVVAALLRTQRHVSGEARLQVGAWKPADCSRNLREYFARIEAQYPCGFFSPTPSSSLPMDAEILMAEHLRELERAVTSGTCELPLAFLQTLYETHLLFTARKNRKGQFKLVRSTEAMRRHGVFYTPVWMVKELLDRSISTRMAQASDQELQTLAVVDPACGAGALLEGALRVLLGHYRKRHGRLSRCTARSIATRCMYGVDIDRHAVALARLVVLVCADEEADDDECSQKESNDRVTTHRHFDIRDSVVHADGLIDTLGAFRINTRFAEVMERGGFQVVVANPPFLMSRRLGMHNPRLLRSLRKQYRCAQGTFDLAHVFVERAQEILARDGSAALLCSSSLLHRRHAGVLRGLLARDVRLREIVDYASRKVFSHAKASTVMVVLGATPSTSVAIHRTSTVVRVPRDDLGEDPWPFLGTRDQRWLCRLHAVGRPLCELADIGFGPASGCDAVFRVRVLERRGELALVRCASGEEIELEAGALLPHVRGRELAGTALVIDKGHMIFPYVSVRNSSTRTGHRLMRPQELHRRFPRVWRWLSRHQARLSRRACGESWYGYAATRMLEFSDRERMLFPSLAAQPRFVYADGDKVLWTGYAMVPRKGAVDMPWLMALLHSRVAHAYFDAVCPTGLYARIFTAKTVGQFPVALPESADARTRAAVRRAGSALMRGQSGLDAATDGLIRALYKGHA